MQDVLKSGTYVLKYTQAWNAAALCAVICKFHKSPNCNADKIEGSGWEIGAPYGAYGDAYGHSLDESSVSLQVFKV